MNKIIKKIISLFSTSVVLISGIVSLTGCSDPEPALAEKTNLVVIYGNHANAPTPDLSLIEDQIMEVASTYGDISVVEVDGAPYVSVRETASQPSANISEKNRKRRARSFTAQIEEKIQEETVPKTEEVDTLKGVQIAARELSDKVGKNVLVLLDSGISTTGALDFTQGSLDRLNIDDTILTLTASNEIPDFSNIDQIITYGIGDVAEPQQSLSSTARANLISLWEAVFATGGKEPNCKEVVFASLSDSAANTMPNVSTITVQKIFPGPKYNTANDTSDPIDFSENVVIEIPENQITFFPDTAEFKDLADATKALEPLAKALKKQNACTLLVGMTATYGEADTARTLSEERARAVAQVLKQLGVSANQVICIGTGYDNTPFHVNDLDADGKLDESLASNNRCVLAMRVETEAAKALLKEYQ